MDDLMDTGLPVSEVDATNAKVDCVEVHEFQHVVDDAAVEPGGFSRVYDPGKKSKITSFVVRIFSSDGTVGEYCPVMGGRRWHMAQVLRLAPGLIGRNPYEREVIYDDFKRALQGVAFVGVGPIDICLWDLFGKRLGTSVSTLLGGYRKKLKAYASCMHGDHNGGLTTTEDVLNFAAYCEEIGFKAFKFHGWGDGGVADLKKVISALGQEFEGRLDLMLDPGCDLRTFADALTIGRACDDAGFYWYEDPFRDGGVSQSAHRKLRQKIRTPLLMTEHVRGLESKADWILSEATDYLRADPEVDLGITGTMKIAHMAEAFGVDVEIHGCGPAHRACMSAIRNTNYYEVGLVGPKVRNYMSPPIYTNDYSDELNGVDKDGFYSVPTGLGLGVEHDWDFITDHTIKVHRYD